MTEKELSKLPIGTILELKMRKNFRTPWRETLRRYIHVEPNWWAHASYGVDSSKKLAEIATIQKVLIPKYEERKPELLDNVELKYLKGLLIPLKEIKYVVKKDCFDGGEMVEKLYFRGALHEDLFSLPPFKKGTKYIGLEKDVNYSLEELGIAKPKEYKLDGRAFDFGIDFGGLWSNKK